MKPQTVRETLLTYKDDKSDKVYRVFLKKIADNLYQVDISYGKKNSKLRNITKTPEAIALTEAETIFHRLINEKLKKGYREVAYSKPAEKTLESCQAIIDRLKEESADNFLARAIAAGLNPLGDFAGTNLSNLNFHLEEFEEEYSDLTNANLQNTNLSGSDLIYVDLSNSNLKNVNLNNAQLWILSATDLTNADLSGAYFHDANLEKANCTDANFTRASFSTEYSSLEEGNFERAKFIETVFASENAINGCNFSYADFSHAHSIQNLFGIKEITKGVNFSYANFSYTDFKYFQFVILKLNLIGTVFNYANLKQADLSNLDLSNTRFIGADLQGANLANSNLTNADLSGANLKGANLTGVNLSKIGSLRNIQIDLKTKIDEQWLTLVQQEAFVPNLEDITQQLKTLQNKPTWQLVYGNYARGEEFPINEVYNNQPILIDKITNGHSLKILISFIGESKQLSLSPQTVWIEPESPTNYYTLVFAQDRGILATNCLPRSLKLPQEEYYQSIITINTQGQLKIALWQIENNQQLATINLAVATRWFTDV